MSDMQSYIVCFNVRRLDLLPNLPALENSFEGLEKG